MNQILEFEQNNGNSGSGGGSDNILKVFAIILIIFAIILIAVVGYSRFSGEKDVKTEKKEETQAIISVETNEDSTTATIKVNHDKNIDKLFYSWNDSKERNIKGSGATLEQTIDVPSGDNTLHIKVVDAIGAETVFDKEISSDKGTDIINPIIELVPTNGGKVKIIATDEKELNFITYRWNEEEETTVYAEGDKKRIEIEIDIKLGENDLTVVAVDAKSNTTTEPKSFIGRTKPKVTLTLSAEGDMVNIKGTHEEGISGVKYNFNGNDINVDIGDGTPNTIEFDQKLEVGTNHIKIVLTSIYGIDGVYEAEYTYGEAG